MSSSNLIRSSSETLDYTSSSKSRAINSMKEEVFLPIGPAVSMCDLLMRSSRVDCGSV